MWQNWTNLVLGLWVIVVAFLGIDASTLTWTLVISGAAIAVLALWGATQTSSSSSSYYRHT